MLRDRSPDLEPLYEPMYPHTIAGYGDAWSGDPHAIGRSIRELCRQYGISDRMPQLIIPGDKQALTNERYWMELGNASKQRVWAYHKAAWAIEDTAQDLGLIYRAMGRKGLESIENVGPRLAAVIQDLCAELSAAPAS